MNNVSLVGRIVFDPEMKYTPSGVAVCKLRIAVDRRFKSESGEKQSDFIDVVCFKQPAEFAANYLGKGRLVAVTGSLRSSNWVQPDGQKRSKLEVTADNIQGLDRANDSKPQAQGEAEGIDFDPFEFE